MIDNVRNLNGVVAAGIASNGLMRDRGVSATVAPAGQTFSASDFLNSNLNAISPEYFDALGMTLIAGRALTAPDSYNKDNNTTASISAVVNESFARRFFSDVNPIGKRFGVGLRGMALPQYQIVGIINDSKYRSLREPTLPTFYVPETNFTSFVLFVRTYSDKRTIMMAVNKRLQSIDPGGGFSEEHTLVQEIRDSTAAERLLADIALVFGCISVLLSAVGIFGLLAFSVNLQRRELGIRIALGASVGQIAAVVGKHILVTTAIGLVSGIALALLLGRFVKALLFGISSHDVSSLLFAVLVMLGVAVFSAVMPVWQAVRTNASETLHYET